MISPRPTTAVAAKETRAVPAATRRVDDGDAGDQAETCDPQQRAIAEMAMPAVEIEVGEQEHDESGRQRHLGAGAPDLLVHRRDLDHFVDEAEVHADIGQHGPGQRGRRREHRCSLDDEQDRQEQCQQAGDADDDAAIERRGVDRILVGFRCPEIDLRQSRGRQFGDEGDDRARVERDLEDVGVRADQPVQGESLAGRDRGDAAGTQIGPEQSGVHQPEMRRHDQPVNLLVGGVGKREDAPVAGRAGVVGLHLDAADDTVGTRRRGDLKVLALIPVELQCAREIERHVVARDLDRLDGVAGRRCGEADQDRAEESDQRSKRKLQYQSFAVAAPLSSAMRA